MIRKTAIAVGIGAAVLVGAAGTAYAAQSDASPTTTPTPTPAAQAHHKHRDRVFRGEQAQWTTFDKKTSTTTVHNAIRGTVTAVSSADITVKDASGTSETFSVGDGTKVHAKGDTASSPGTISQVKVGDRALVLGTGSGTSTATHIRDRGTPSAPQQ